MKAPVGTTCRWLASSVRLAVVPALLLGSNATLYAALAPTSAASAASAMQANAAPTMKERAASALSQMPMTLKPIKVKPMLR